VPCSTVLVGTSSIGDYAATDAAASDNVAQVSKRPGRQAVQTTHSARRPAVPAELSLGTQPRHVVPTLTALAKRPEEPVLLPAEPMGGVEYQQQQQQHGKSNSSDSSTMNGKVNECYLLPSSQTAGPDLDYPAPGQQRPPTPLQPTQEADAFGRSSSYSTASYVGLQLLPRYPGLQRLRSSTLGIFAKRSHCRQVAASEAPFTTINCQSAANFDNYL